jgi:hypothetical protein
VIAGVGSDRLDIHATQENRLDKVQFVSNIGTPNDHFFHKLIPRIEARCTAVFEYVPVLLGGIATDQVHSAAANAVAMLCTRSSIACAICSNSRPAASSAAMSALK